MAIPLQGSYQFDAATIDRVVTQRLPGAYVLGYKQTGRMFSVQFVGRAENSLNVRLKQKVELSRYTAFMFQYYESAQQAFEAECNVFHTFAPPDNKSHPTRPQNVDWRCPGCRQFG